MLKGRSLLLPTLLFPKTFLKVGELASISPAELSAPLITQSDVVKGFSPNSTHSTLA
jgi:hypothetical protein